MTNNQLTDAQISNATLIRLIRWADEHKSHYVAAALRELQERRKADREPVVKKVVCWSCQNEVEISAIADCDGCCPKCGTRIHLDEEPYIAPLSAPDRDQVRREHAEWSQATFGNVGPVGPLKHLSKEALEAAEQPGDLSEWADMQFLLWDAQRRAGITDEQITQAMIDKLAVNKQRSWPEPKDGEPRLHIKEQQAPVGEREPIAWLNDAYLARGVVDGEAGSEDAGPGYIPVYREAGPRPAPVVTYYRDGIEAAAKWVDKLREAYDSEHGWSDPDTGVFEFGNDAQREYSTTLEELAEGIRALHPNAGNCRENANSSTNNCREIPETSTNRSREHFISLCNEFWNWSEMDEVCAEDRGYELRMEWDGKVFKHPVTQALWRMYQAAPQEVK